MRCAAGELMPAALIRRCSRRLAVSWGRFIGDGREISRRAVMQAEARMYRERREADAAGWRPPSPVDRVAWRVIRGVK